MAFAKAILCACRQLESATLLSCVELAKLLRCVKASAPSI